MLQLQAHILLRTQFDSTLTYIAPPSVLLKQSINEHSCIYNELLIDEGYQYDHNQYIIIHIKTNINIQFSC